MINKISFFSDNIKNTSPTRLISIGDFLDYVKYGQFRQLQLEIAQIEDIVKRREKKASILPYVTISGVFQKRAKDGLLSHSGFIGVDMDYVEDLEKVRVKLIADPYTYAVFKSVSGTGLCVVVKVTPSEDKHLSHFNWLSKYYYDNYGIVIDESGKDTSRARFVSFDPDVFINEKSKKAGVKQKVKIEKKTVPFIATGTQMDRIVTDICSSGINLTESYEEYLTVGFSIASEFMESGRQYFHAVCSMSTKYNTRECDKKYNHILKSNNGHYSIGTFFYLAKQAGITLYTHEEKKAQDIAKAAKRSNSTIDGAVKTALTMHDGITEKMVREAAEAVFSATERLYEADEDTPVIEQITNFIDVNHTFKKNKFTRTIEDQNGREVDDQFTNTIYIKSKAIIGNKVNKGDIEAIINSDRTRIYDPFKDFYEKNCTLPSKPEVIDEFISGLKSDTPDFEYWVKKWLVGIPAACNGEIVRIVLVLCGGQNTGKTTWFRWILPKQLRKYYAESRLDRGKDDEIAMTQNLIIMDDEFGGKTRKDVEKFKELVSKDTFFLREPYGRKNVHIRRLALLCGTSNPTDVINDPTGNTRIIPIHITDIDHKLNESIDRNQLFVELFRAYESGESWRLTSEDVKKFEQFNDNHEEVQTERELLDQFFEDGEDFFTTTMIKNYIETHSVQKILGVKKLAIELKKKYKMKKINGNRGYYLKTKAQNPQGALGKCPTELPF